MGQRTSAVLHCPSVCPGWGKVSEGCLVVTPDYNIPCLLVNVTAHRPSCSRSARYSLIPDSQTSGILQSFPLCFPAFLMVTLAFLGMEFSRLIPC